MSVNVFCRDAQGMAKGVNDALADILVEQGKTQKSDALKLLVQWMNDKRYLRDLVRHQKLFKTFDFLIGCTHHSFLFLFI